MRLFVFSIITTKQLHILIQVNKFSSSNSNLNCMSTVKSVNVHEKVLKWLLKTSWSHFVVLMEIKTDLLTPVLLNQDRHCLWKQCRSRSDGFWRNHLIMIYTVFHSTCEFIWTYNTELPDWLMVRNGCGKLNLFKTFFFCFRPRYMCFNFT